MAASGDNPPVRSFMDDPKIVWRTKKPDFSLVDKKYMAERIRNHKEGSLEKIAENLVKTWEMESTHKVRAEDWGTIDPEKYRFSMNLGKRHDIEFNIANGNYNMMLLDSPLFDVTSETSESSHTKFKSAFPGGFAWELLDIISGPPKVSFTWRHWATWEGEFGGNQPTGETLEMNGMCIAEVDDKLRMTDLQVFFDPHPLIGTILGHTAKKCPFSNVGK